MNDDKWNLVELAADVVGAYVSNNPVPAADLPKLIADVYAAMQGVGSPPVEAAPEPAVNPKKSVFPDYLISLEDGKQYKMLRRHLSTRGMTTDDYRAKWKLPHDYPMVAPNYSERRSALAKTTGLGKKKAEPAPQGPAKAKRRRPANGASE